MNRFLSGLRSRALKNIELSRGVGIAGGYGDCNLQAKPGEDMVIVDRGCEG